VVPDSRSMLCIEPYERPVDATSVRMLAPPSYMLRNSVSNSSRDLFIFFIVIIGWHLPARLMPRRIPSVGSDYTTGAKLMKRLLRLR
jgi:hypothetical protein